MRTWWWACALIVVLTCSAIYLLITQFPIPERPLAVSDVPAQPSGVESSEQPRADQSSSLPVADKAEPRLADVDSDPAALKQDQSPAPQQAARLDDALPSDDAPSREAAAPSIPDDTLKQNRLLAPQQEARLEDALRPDDGPSREAATRSIPDDTLKQNQLLAPQQEARLEDALRPDAAPSRDAAAPSIPDDTLKQDQTPALQQEARLENAFRPDDGPSPAAAGLPTPEDIKPNLSWLAFYAYSELPPNPKPANIVLDALRSFPPGTPIEEIRRVANILGLDPNFMKAVARIESGFNPKQRTGSYIGLFQLSLVEFGKYGSGDIRDPRDNAVAGALKMMTEAILFESYTHRKPTLSDLYLVHQQGIDGATEHISQPNRSAWRAMCATDEGKEKGERWCKRAIWGNTLPTLKKAWKNVNNVTSAAFVGMWRERVSEFYSRYSTAAAN